MVGKIPVLAAKYHQRYLFGVSCLCYIFRSRGGKSSYSQLGDNLLTLDRPMSAMHTSTISVLIFVEKLLQRLEKISKKRSQNERDMSPFPIRMMAQSLNIPPSRQNLANTSHHATRTNFLSVESSLTTSFVH